MKKGLAIVVLIGLLGGELGLAFFGSYRSPKTQNEQPPREQRSEQSKKNEGHSHKSAPKPAIQIECDPNCTAKDSDKSGNQNYVAWFFEKLTGDPLVMLTGVLAVANALLVITVSATAVRQLRAYVLSTKPHIYQLEVGKIIEVGIPYKNFGQTPAYKVVGRSWLDLLPYPLPSKHRFNKPEDPKKPVVTTTVAPDDSFQTKARSSSSAPITQEIIDRIKLGDDFRLYVYGSIEYRDVFRRKRVTKFCYCYDSYAFTGAGEVSLADQHNETT